MIYRFKLSKKSKAHIWNDERQDTYCKMWSTGGLSQSGNWKDSDKTNKPVCSMCTINYNKGHKIKTFRKQKKYIPRTELNRYRDSDKYKEDLIIHNQGIENYNKSKDMPF